MLHFRTTRKSDGRRVENKIPIGLIRDLPDKHTAAEVERLHLPINPVDSRRGVTFGDSLIANAGPCRTQLCSQSNTDTPRRRSTAFSRRPTLSGSGAKSEAMEWTAIMVQDESVGFVQGAAFRSGNHCALRALVPQIQTELSGLGPNDGGTRNCAGAHNDSALGITLCT